MDVWKPQEYEKGGNSLKKMAQQTKHVPAVKTTLLRKHSHRQLIQYKKTSMRSFL